MSAFVSHLFLASIALLTAGPLILWKSGISAADLPVKQHTPPMLKNNTLCSLWGLEYNQALCLIVLEIP